MDPNPNKFPILSFVLSRVNSTLARTPNPAPDLEQPDADDRHRAAAADEDRRRDAALIAQMPGLNDPALVAAMAEAVSQVSQTRAVLSALGDRPDHEAVDRARAGFAEADAALARQVEELALSPPPAGDAAAEWRARQEELERGCRRRAEADKAAYKAVMRLEQMHDAYEKVLGEAEERLLRIYRAAGSGGGAGLGEGEALGGKGKEVMNEEVASILRDGESGKLIKWVDLSGRQLTLVPEAFGRIRGLVSLNLSNNQFQTLPDSIAGLDILEELRISSNLLATLPDSIGLLLRLKYLDISSNKLTALPDSISNCRSMVEINASFNKLSYLPTNIGYELVNLQKLDVYLNKLRSLPSSIGEMKSLRILDAHFNELRGLPHSIGKLTNLEILNLSSNFNDLTELPDTLGDLISLRELDLSNNQIHALPITFGRLNNLTKLNLDQNPLIIPPADVLNKGVEAVKNYMSRMWLDILLEEEQKSMQEANTISSPTVWLNRSTSWLNNFVSGVSNNVSGYLGGAGGKSFKDPYLDQQL